MRWLYVVGAFVLIGVAVLLYGRAPQQQPFYETRGRHDLAELAKTSLQAIEKGDFSAWKATLPPGEAARYGMTNDELRQLFTEYLVPAFQGGVGEYRLSLNLDQGMGSCERRYWVDQQELSVGVAIAFQSVERKWGYWNTLYATLSNAWLLEGFRAGKVSALPYSAAAFAAKSDRKKLEALGLKHFPSNKPGLASTWDQQIQSLTLEADRRARLDEAQQIP